MNEFMIRFASAENALEHMQQVESAIRSQSEEISKIRREFRADFRGKARILQNLYNQMNRMSGIGDSAKVFEDSLESILGIYNAVEQELLGQVEDTGRSGAAPSAVSSGGENASEKDREQDYIHNAGKRDEKRSLIPGASIIGAGTIGQYLLGDDQDPAGDPAGTQRAGGGEGQNADQAADGAGTSQAAPAVTDLDDLTAVLFPIPVDPDRIFKKEDPWEDFLHFLPAWLVEMLPDFALEYLHELFDLFRNLTELFGDVRFLDAEDILICGIWGTFYTLLIWYFYQKAFPQDGDTIETKSEDIRPIDESAEDGDPSEEEQELEDGPGEEESTREEDSNSVEEPGQDEDTSENKQDSVEDQGQDEETSENKQDSAEDRGQDESTAEKDGGAAEENSGAGDPENSPLKMGDDTSDRGQQTNDSRGEAGKNTADPSSDNRGGNSADDSGAKNMPGKPASDPAGDSKAAKPVTDPAGAGDSTASKPAADSAGDSVASKPAADPAGSSTVEKPATDPSIKSTTVKPIENPAAKSEAAKAAADPKAASRTAKAAADPKAASGTAKTADTGAGKTSGSGKPSGGGGGKSSGGGGKSSGGGGGKSSGGGGSGTDASYLPEDTAAEVTDPGASDTTGDYLTSLLGEDSRNSTGISDWAKSTMDNWGQKAAEKLAESGAGEAAEKAAQTAAGIGGSPIGRTARSIVCAAVINAGIDMAMQGAGAVGSVLGGKDDLFKELGDSELV